MEPQNFHGPSRLQRPLPSGRRSMPLLDGKGSDQLRRHVWAVTMGDERPLPVGSTNRHSAELMVTERPRKLQSKRRASLSAPYPGSLLVQQADTIAGPNATAAMSTVVTIRPLPMPTLDTVLELPPIQEHIEEEVVRLSEKPVVQPLKTSRSAPTYTLFSTQPHRPADLPRSSSLGGLTKLNRPRRLSGQPPATKLPNGGVVSDFRRPSWKSATSFESFESSSWRPRPTYAQQSQANQTVAKPQRSLQEVFGALPAEVLALILEKLKASHLDDTNDSCATCWMRDVYSICLSSRKWYRTGRRALYEDIQLVGQDSAAHKKRFKQVQGSRLLLLRRTLRANPDLASLVRVVKVPRFDAVANKATPKTGMTALKYEDLVATLVMACPNLERLDGQLWRFEHEFRKLFQALSTRTRLTQMDWLVDVSTSSADMSNHQGMPARKGRPMSPEALSSSQERALSGHFANWSSLTSLSIHCLPGGTLAADTLSAPTLATLPSLRHLHLCNIPRTAFNDNHLLSLPVLHTLTLSHLGGITSQGLSAFATLTNSGSLRGLHLRHAPPLVTLPAIARILSNLGHLRAFSLVQARPPMMPESDSFTLWMMPYLASSSVEKLHWDITTHHGDIGSDGVSVADDILARSIAAGGFPKLQTLRTPNDPEGVFQSLCCPVERIDLPGDHFRETNSALPGSASATRLGSRLQKSSSTTSLASSPPLSPTRPPPHTDLCTARLAAQSRLEAARQKPRFHVNVFDEYGLLFDKFSMAGFIGTQGSAIDYCLLPDSGSSDERGGLVDVRDLGSDAGESIPGAAATEAGGQRGCTGSWNRGSGPVADKKEAEKWWHSERGRWRRVALN